MRTREMTGVAARLAREAVRAAVGWMAGYLTALAVCGLITLCCGGCRSTGQSVGETVRDSVREVLVERVDSVRDSIYVSLIERGDTVWVKEYRDRYRYIVRHDTLRIVARDTVKVSVAAPKAKGGGGKGNGLAGVLIIASIVLTAIITKKIYGRRRQEK